MRVVHSECVKLLPSPDYTHNLVNLPNFEGAKRAVDYAPNNLKYQYRNSLTIELTDIRCYNVHNVAYKTIILQSLYLTINKMNFLHPIVHLN